MGPILYPVPNPQPNVENLLWMGGFDSRGNFSRRAYQRTWSIALNGLVSPGSV
jgi:inosine-uridine nucleoside N-ribohydrolase